jgi:hypothetical protein
MDPAQALADLVEISSQIEAVVLVDDTGAVVASTLSDGARIDALARSAGEIAARADEAAAPGRTPIQIELALLDGSIFVVRDEGRTILATTRPDPTVGLVLYDLRSCLRNAAGAPAKPKRSRARKPKGDGDAAA